MKKRKLITTEEQMYRAGIWERPFKITLAKVTDDMIGADLSAMEAFGPFVQAYALGFRVATDLLLGMGFKPPVDPPNPGEVVPAGKEKLEFVKPNEKEIELKGGSNIFMNCRPGKS